MTSEENISIIIKLKFCVHSMLRQIFIKKSKVRTKTPAASKVIP